MGIPHDQLLMYYHPCTWMFVDDQEGFLNAIELVLPDDRPYVMSAGTSLGRKLVDQLIDGRLLQEPDVTWKSVSGESVIRSVERGISLPSTFEKRFGSVSVVVCDYAMPGVNGLQFLDSIRDPNVRKILLTGVADESTAIEAFNNGLIDRFVVKNDPDAVGRTFTHATELEVKRFLAIQESVWGRAHEGLTYLRRSDIALEHMMSVCRKMGTVEYYYSDFPPGFALIDASGRASFLLLFDRAYLGRMVADLRSRSVSKQALDSVASGLAYPLGLSGHGEFGSPDASEQSFVATHLVANSDSIFSADPVAMLRSNFPVETSLAGHLAVGLA